jgi:uncharacterized membrane protein YjdF
MLHSLILLAGLASLPWLISRVFGKSISRSDWVTVGVAMTVTAVVAGTLFILTDNERPANFALHALGGGVPAAVLYILMRKVFGLKLTVWQDLILLFFFVSGLGALNELAEFLLDVTTGFSYSRDRFDTWYDILANSLGALFGWLVLLGWRRGRDSNPR